jgi:hypothetical protein
MGHSAISSSEILILGRVRNHCLNNLTIIATFEQERSHPNFNFFAYVQVAPHSVLSHRGIGHLNGLFDASQFSNIGGSKISGGNVVKLLFEMSIVRMILNWLLVNGMPPLNELFAKMRVFAEKLRHDCSVPEKRLYDRLMLPNVPIILGTDPSN